MEWIEQAINLQREYIEGSLTDSLKKLASTCANSWPNRTLLDYELNRYLKQHSDHHCRLLYVVDKDGLQRSSNISDLKTDSSIVGRDMSARPYHQEMVLGADEEFVLSKVYVDRNTQKPCITALSRIVINHKFKGYVAADFCLNNLPSPEQKSPEQEKKWHKIQADPAIRSVLLHQTRSVNVMDKKMDEVMEVVDSLMTKQGIFHVKFHFASSRATLWTYNDPFRYRLHVLDELIDPEVCQVYEKTAYPESACVDPELIPRVLAVFKAVREADGPVYLRSASLNIMNGFVGLSFSCNGSHYMQADEFLSKELGFWLGQTEQNLCHSCEAYEYQP